MSSPTLPHRLWAEFIGTFWLVFGGCGSAVLAAQFDGGDGNPARPRLPRRVVLAFGLTVVTMAYALGHISGGHFNPAVTLGLLAAKRFRVSRGAAVHHRAGHRRHRRRRCPVLRRRACRAATASTTAEAGAFAANGFDELSPGGYNLSTSLVIELVLTFDLPVRHPRRHRPQGPRLQRPDGHRPGPRADPPHRSPSPTPRSTRPAPWASPGSLAPSRCRRSGCSSSPRWPAPPLRASATPSSPATPSSTEAARDHPIERVLNGAPARAGALVL